MNEKKLIGNESFLIKFKGECELPFITITKNSWSLIIFLKGNKKVVAKYRKPRRKDKNIKYKYYINVYDKVDFSYEIHKNKLKESIIFKDKTAINYFVFIIKTDLELRLNLDRTISVYDKDRELYYIDKPYMFDANGNYSENIIYIIRKIKGGFELVVEFDANWINSRERRYPVVLDPTFVDMKY